MKDEILRLRSLGMSYGQIQGLLGCSKSTISFHCGVGQKVKNNNRRNKTRKVWIKELKKVYGGKCAICQYDKSLNALDFHHTDPLNKVGGVSELFSGRGAKAALAEAKKCILVCRNCHAELHENE